MLEIDRLAVLAVLKDGKPMYSAKIERLVLASIRWNGKNGWLIGWERFYGIIQGDDDFLVVCQAVFGRL